jgi:hypothetical protein
MLEENYITSAMYDRLAGSLAPLMRDHAYAAVQTILRIKEPHLDFLRLYFEVHSSTSPFMQLWLYPRTYSKSSKPSDMDGWRGPSQ